MGPVLVEETKNALIRDEGMYRFPDLTMVRGMVVYHDGEFAEAGGRNVRSSAASGSY